MILFENVFARSVIMSSVLFLPGITYAGNPAPVSISQSFNQSSGGKIYFDIVGGTATSFNAWVASEFIARDSDGPIVSGFDLTNFGLFSVKGSALTRVQNTVLTDTVEKIDSAKKGNKLYSDTLSLSYPNSLNDGRYMLQVTGSGTDVYNGKLNYSFTPISPVPEPETYAMLLAGLGLLVFKMNRKKIFARAQREVHPGPAEGFLAAA